MREKCKLGSILSTLADVSSIAVRTDNPEGGYSYIILIIQKHQKSLNILKYKINKYK
jgi:hypothetical protein